MTKTEFCFDCEAELNAENTREHDGFDSSNHFHSTMYGGDSWTAPFTKCDNCFEADIDRHLDSFYQ